MISGWWLLIAFVGGSWAGMLMMALMRVTRSADQLQRQVERRASG
jgi:hypothetical protein